MKTLLLLTALLCQWQAVSAQIIADHTVVAKYDSIPQEWIDSVKCMLLILPGESHGRGYHYGLEDLAAADSTYAATVAWGGTPETYTASHLRSSRVWRYGSSWSGGCGEGNFYTNETARNNVKSGLTYTRANYSGKIAFGFGWCWDMTWMNSPGGTADPVYGCRWAGSSVDGPQGNMQWGIDNGDTALTGNTVTMQTYLDAVEAYNAHEPGITTFYTTGPIDGVGGSENGYQRWLKHCAIRDTVLKKGGYLFDYADILCWEDGVENMTSWYNSVLSRTEAFQTGDPDLASGGTAYLGSQGLGCHITREGCEALAKAMWWFMARIAGWDGTTAGDTVVAAPVISPAAGTYEEEVTVSISCATVNAAIHYTTDGTDPDTTDAAYTAPFTLIADTELRARAYRDTLTPSSIVSAVYAVVPDTAGPELVNAYANSSTGIVLEFNEPLHAGSVMSGGGYSVDNGISVITGNLMADGMSVQLAVTPAFSDGTVYTVSVFDVMDSNGNRVTAGCSASFGYNACTAYWNFDETSGDTARDGSGYGHHAAVGSAQWSTDAARGGALAFDGDDIITLTGKTFGIDTTGAFSVAFWFKCSTVGGNMAVLGAYYRPFGVYFNGNNVRTCVRTDATNYETGDSIISVGIWYHCALTFENGSRTMYLNGGIDNQSSLAGAAAISSGQTLWLGEGFGGLLDEVRIYNRALSQDEVRALMDDENVPVALSSFTVTETGSGMQLDWTTQSETGNLGWHVYRRQPGEPLFSRITDEMIPGNGTTAVVSEYRFLDVDCGDAAGLYEYYLQQYDYDMTVWQSNIEGADLAVSTVTGGRERGAASASVLPAAAPCPFAGTVTVRCPGSSVVTIRDGSGVPVRTLALSGNAAVWDGRNGAGTPVKDGVYFATAGTQAVRLVLIR